MQRPWLELEHEMLIPLLTPITVTPYAHPIKIQTKKNHFLANNEDSAGWEVIFLKIAYVIHFEINQ